MLVWQWGLQHQIVALFLYIYITGSSLFLSPYQVTYPLWWHPSKGKLVRKRRLSWCNKLLWLQQNCQRNIIKGLKCFLQPNYLQSFFPFLQYYEQCPTRWQGAAGQWHWSCRSFKRTQNQRVQITKQSDQESISPALNILNLNIMLCTRVMLTSVQYDSDQKQGYELGSGLSGLLVPDECDVQLVWSKFHLWKHFIWIHDKLSDFMWHDIKQKQPKAGTGNILHYCFVSGLKSCVSHMLDSHIIRTSLLQGRISWMESGLCQRNHK